MLSEAPQENRHGADYFQRDAPDDYNRFLFLAVCCSVLQCFAVCCSVLQCVAVCCSVLRCVTVCCVVLQFVTVCCSVLQCLFEHDAPDDYNRFLFSAVCCIVCVAVCCSVFQCVAVSSSL